MSRGAQVAGCCAAALAPLAVLAVDPRGWSPYGPAKWLVVGVLGSAAVAGALVGGRLRLGRGPTVALAAFVAWAAVCAAVGDDRLYAWIGTPERHLGVATWAMCLGLLVVGSTLAADGARRVVGSVVAATAVLAASGMVELAGWQPGGLRTDERVLGPFGSSAYTGAASLLLVPVAVGVALDRSWSSRARAAAGAAAGGLVVLVATGARAAVLGAVVAMALGTVAVRARRPGLGRATVAGLVAAAVVGVVAVAGITGAAGRWERLWSDRDGGARGRLDEWAVAARVVAANPVVGVGPEGYRIAFGAHVDAGYERRHGRAVLPDRAHAGPLDVAATTGLPGLALWGAAVVLVGRRVGRALQADGLRPAGASPGGAIAGRSAPPGGVEELRSGDPSSRDGSADQLHGDGPAPPWVVGVAIGLAAYLAGQLVLFPLAEVDPVAWLLAGALLAAVARPGELAEVALPRPVALVPAAVAGLVLVAGAADVVADRRARVAVDALDQGRSAVAVSAANDAARWRGDAVRYRLLAAEASVRAGGLTALGHALDEVDAALDVSPADPVVRGRQAQLLARRAGLTGQPAHLEAARRAWADVVDDDPRNASHRLAYGTVLAEVGDRPGAEAQWLRAEDLAPTAAAPSVDLALLYLAEGRTAEAVAAAERAVARAPGDPTALGALEAARQGAARTSEAGAVNPLGAGRERFAGVRRLPAVQTTTEADLAPRAAAAPLPLVHLDAEATPVAADVAFADFYQRTRVPVARALALTLGDVELAGEAVDEAMARAYQRWGQVSHYDNPGGWVYRVGLNWGRSVLRVRRRSLHRLYQPDAVEAASIADPDVARALGELSVNHRAVIVCRHLLGWSEQATADALHIRPGTVKSRLSRATAQLQVRLGHLRPEEQQP